MLSLDLLYNMDLQKIINLILGKPNIVSPIPQSDMIGSNPIQQALQAFNQGANPEKPPQAGEASNFHYKVVPPTPTPTPEGQPSSFHWGVAPTNQPDPTPTPFNEKKVLDGYTMDTPKEYIALIDKAAKDHKVPTSLISSLLAQESMHFNPDVISGKLNSPVGAQGIAQFMPETAKGMGVDPLDIKSAINGAAKLLRGHYDNFNQRADYALAAYNAGAGAVSQYGGVPPYPETQNYVKNIMNMAQKTYGGN